MRLSSSHSIGIPSATEPGAGLAGSVSPTELIFENGANLAPTSSGDAVKVDINCQRPGEDLSAVEDGPLFRATMKALEQKTGSMRARMKKVLKKAEAARLAQVECNEAVAGFMDALRETATSNANAVQPALEHYFEKIAKEILNYERQNTANMQTMVIEPLTKLYHIDIKAAEAKKRDFEEESREYYSYLGRYLGQRQDSMKEKKRAESDSKYQSRRKNFELSRFDYSSFMQDLHGGRKEQEVLSHLTRYAAAQAKCYLETAKKVGEMIPQLDALTQEVNEADREFQSQRTEREGKRRTIEMSTKAYVEPESGSVPLAPSSAPSNGNMLGASDLDFVKSESSTSTLRPTTSHATSVSQPLTAGEPGPSALANASLGASALPQDAVNLKSTSGSNKYKGIRDLEERDQSNGVAHDRSAGQQRKEGLLWAMSRPGSHADPRGLNKRAWHKLVEHHPSSLCYWLSEQADEASLEAYRRV
jgi:Arf-GAP/SH3 domain/ANK repeat/PH domain-containing protein